MSMVSEEGILLRTHRYSESSRILRFLTPGHGILAVMDRGGRRGAPKGKGSVETFDEAVIVLSYRESRDLHTLKELEVVRSRRRLGSALLRFAGASLLAELLVIHALQGANRELFLSLRGSLDALERADPDALPGVILSGAWSLLARAGFPPELERCARCAAALPAEGILRFAVPDGGILCDRCGVEEEGARLGPGARGDLVALLAGEVPERLRGAAVHLTLLERYALHHLEANRPLRAAAFLRPLLREKDAPGAPAPAAEPGP